MINQKKELKEIQNKNIKITKIFISIILFVLLMEVVVHSYDIPSIVLSFYNVLKGFPLFISSMWLTYFFGLNLIKVNNINIKISKNEKEEEIND